ncbi:MAG: 3-isopropylmalate dehydratase small subunit [Alphaproteobacteria bacterium]
MDRFTTLTAVAAPYEPANVDTDQILPARFLKMPRGNGKHYGGFLFHDIRFADDGAERADFVLNRPEFRAARILVANTNFACGSSREGAVYAFLDAGFRAVVAPSFSDIFFNNCLKNGVVPVRLPEADCAGLRALLAARPGTELTVDLEAQELRVPGGAVHRFEVDGFFREMLLKGVDEVGLTIGLRAEIEGFERRHHAANAWAAR